MGTESLNLHSEGKGNRLSNEEDIAVRGISQSGTIRVMACVTKQMVNEMQRRHHTWPVATAALGRTSSIAAMMGLMLKGNERLTIQIKGDGPVGSIVVDADAEGRVRGYVEQPFVDLPSNHLGKLDVGGAVGDGMLYVIRDQGLKDYYRGSAELQTGEIGDDFTYYFAVSEQTPSSVGAGVLVDTDNSVLASGGFIVQLMPGYDEEELRQLETRVANMDSVTNLLMTGLQAEDLLLHVVPGATVMERKNLTFHCDCSRHRLRVILKSLGKAELESLVQDPGYAEVTCHFCGEVYLFEKPELAELASELQSLALSDQASPNETAAGMHFSDGESAGLDDTKL